MRGTRTMARHLNGVRIVAGIALLMSTWVFAQESPDVPEDSPIVEQPPVEAPGADVPMSEEPQDDDTPMQTPHGWSHGKKMGWNGDNSPPASQDGRNKELCEGTLPVPS